MGGHKGFALAFMIDVLAGCLTGARLSPEIPGDPNSPGPQGTGHCFVAVQLDSLRPRSEYEQSLERLARAVHSAARADWAEPFMIPGEREAQAVRERAGAIPFTESAAALLRELGQEFGVPFPA
jgi:LDH2 family malate/lactate/ureidoglycolate dehydrogenase